jgi:lipoyl(octanoyl) transferase
MEWKISLEPVAYEEALAFMEDRVQAIIAGQADEMVWLLEHPPLFTAGSSAKDEDLIDGMGFPIYKTGRGGQYTYHGPGQRIAYVMLDLRKRRQDIRWFVSQLEQWIIATLEDFGVKSEIREGRVGVWVNTKNSEAKIAALGIRIKKWVTLHGIALNINPNLEHYRGIVPCGISEFGVTSLTMLGIQKNYEEVDTKLKENFTIIFGGE